ncbi:hypothetical protein LJC68_08130 [Bacteroidales bacterium OttesenSCG-928-B11]|nr:hypothetical protein [Bacteroidales bacterium OttesenSCG-928-B11]
MDKGANLAWHSHDGNGYFLVGASSLVNGKVNMEAIKACDLPLSDFPIFKWCEDKNTGGVTGWYLPSWDEALEIAKSYQVLQTSLQSNGGSTFSSNYVWSSSEKDDDEAYYIDMKNKDSDKHWKNFSDGFDARAIKEF